MAQNTNNELISLSWYEKTFQRFMKTNQERKKNLATTNNAIQLFQIKPNANILTLTGFSTRCA